VVLTQQRFIPWASVPLSYASPRHACCASCTCATCCACIPLRCTVFVRCRPLQKEWAVRNQVFSAVAVRPLHAAPPLVFVQG
jgi:hypothetical protein